MDILLKCAQASKLSYKNFVNHNKRTKKIRLSSGTNGIYIYTFINQEPAQCLVLENKNEIIIAIRGTADFQDVKSDLDIHHAHDNLLGDVHEGFYDQMKKLEPEIISILESVSPKKDIYVTGHSLGGAIAKLLTLRMGFSSTRKITCITFGEPKSIPKKE